MGEALREIAILVFVPLDWFLGPHEDKSSVTLAAFPVAVLLFAMGVQMGLRGEIEGS